MSQMVPSSKSDSKRCQKESHETEGIRYRKIEKGLLFEAECILDDRTKLGIVQLYNRRSGARMGSTGQFPGLSNLQGRLYSKLVSLF